MSSSEKKSLHHLMAKAVSIFGEEILAEDRLRGIISDLGFSEYLNFLHVFSRSVTDCIGGKILSFRELDHADFNLKVANLREDFQESNFFKPGVSNYVIDCYLYALGLLDDIEEYDPESDTGTVREGELTFADHYGVQYCGNLNADDQKSGFGIAKNEDGGYYAGEWKLNMKAGIGQMVDSCKNKYAGEMKMNRKAGVGVLIREDGCRYSGEWKNGRMNGAGILFHPNGESMYTSFSNDDVRRGTFGVYTFRDGTYVTGGMTINGPDGRCTHVKRDGAAVDELWSEGKFIKTL